MNGAGYFSPRYFGAAFISTRPAPGPHQAQTKGFMNKAAPSSGLNSLHGQRSNMHIALARASGASYTAGTEHFRSVYGVFSYHDSYPLCGRVREWVIVKVARLC